MGAQAWAQVGSSTALVSTARQRVPIAWRCAIVMASADNSVALGTRSVADRQNSVSVVVLAMSARSQCAGTEGTTR